MYCPKHGLSSDTSCLKCDVDSINAEIKKRVQKSLHEFRAEVCKRVLKFYEGTNSFHGFDMPLIDSYYPNIDKAVEAATDDTCILPYRKEA